MELMEKMEKVEWITGNPPHVHGMANRGLIILNSLKVLSKFAKCFLIVNALGS